MSGDHALPDTVPHDRWCLVVGNEHKGLSRGVQKEIDYLVSIPMAGQLDSLNVSVATGIMLYHFTQKTR